MKAKKKLAAIIAVLTLAAALSGCGNAIEYKMPTASNPDGDSSTAEDNSQPSAEDPTPDDDGGSADDGSSGTDVPNIDIPSLISPTVEETDEEYFKKAAFVGEALCSGIGFYVSDIGDEHVYAENNAHVGDILNTRWVIDGTEYGLADALYVTERKYVYVWIGPNDLNNYTPQGFAEKYQELINTLFFSNPMAYVGVISVAPVSSAYEQSLTGGTIEDYNMALAEMVDKIGNNRVFFFNITATLGDANGNLLADYDSGDGLHMTGAAYKAVATYLFDSQIHPYVSDFELPETDDADTDSSDGGEGADGSEAADGETAEAGAENADGGAE